MGICVVVQTLSRSKRGKEGINCCESIECDMWNVVDCCDPVYENATISVPWTEFYDMPHVIAWDPETIPDISEFTLANDLLGKLPDEVREAPTRTSWSNQRPYIPTVRQSVM
jgi:hypothetical protein